ncbi:MAG TPA: phosphatidylserine/phosphatidylglycerophosphate/cardiolipin synthase family protein [Verrucomicrobiae bacterium]|jgi:cardiolipin synthase|nr:phosphatidylserine/phosphatidylglycerophosphate/cardiolipin synthase family protein [Verrucomicrobiae bacterium]
MPRSQKTNGYRWLSSGVEIFPALFAAMENAQKTIRLEIYIFANDELGRKFRDALIAARVRGVRVQVLIDAFGSTTLPDSFWEPLRAVEGEVRVFNPVFYRRLGFRDHRKMLVCDEDIAYIGGFNVAEEYNGDGITKGWYDVGLEISSPLAVQLAAAFDEMFSHADSPHQLFLRTTHSSVKRDVTTDAGKLLLSGPSRGRSLFLRYFRRDLSQAQNVQIICAYFLPGRRIRRHLNRIARKGGKVQVLFPGKSDVFVSRLAAQSLYRRMLKAGVEIYEYEPQVLHAKLMLVDDLVYAGSSNLDPRSLYLNYELMVRVKNPKLVAEAREMFARDLKYAKRVERAEWKKSRTWWNRMKERWAYFIIARIDPLIARWDYRRARR